MGGGNSIFQLPEDICESLICSKCGAYLSCGPVHLLEGDKYICGRCPVETELPQILYDQVMEKISFPCRYKNKGCVEYFLFNKTTEHEKVCVSRTFPCPAGSNRICKELICLKEAKEHFKVNHSSHVLEKNEFIIDREVTQRKNLLLFINDDLIIIQYCYKVYTKTLYIELSCFTNKPNTVLSYNLKFVNPNFRDCSTTCAKKSFAVYKLIIDTVFEDVINMEPYLSILGNPRTFIVEILTS